MSSEPGMCPQRLFTNTKLFTIAGKRNPTRARSSPDLAGGAGPKRRGEGGSFSDPLRAEQRCAQGAAQQGRRVRLGLRSLRLCLRGAEGLWLMPCSGLKGPGALSFSPAAPRALLSPSPPHLAPHPAFLSPTRLGENSQRRRHPHQKLRFQTKSCFYPQLGGSNQPLIFTFSL